MKHLNIIGIKKNASWGLKKKGDIFINIINYEQIKPLIKYNLIFLK